jgi:hypothetical protein
VRGNGVYLSPFALETTGGHGASTASVNLLFTKQMRDSGLPADVLVGKLKKDISFALRRGTIAQVTTALDVAQQAAEDESLPSTDDHTGIGRTPLLPSISLICSYLLISSSLFMLECPVQGAQYRAPGT